ncbi:MAG: hypothetical protein KGI29_05620 [Pseudomonadota bacterium]|nr:hypothetical protein [Pseudomonadota bacterium]MDE3037713.1 hypothetical protein [Pseudomonadota bacterium]
MAEEKQPSGQAIDQILAQPLSGLRVAIADKFQQEGISPETLEGLKKQLLQSDFVKDAEEAAVLKREITNTETAIRTGRAAQAPNLEYPSTQLLWAASLGHIISNPDTVGNWPATNRADNVTKTALWKQITSSPYMREELRDHAFHIADSIRNPNARIRWGTPPTGYPAVGYYYNQEENLVNIDLLWSLLGGIEHSRAANLHEIGHSQLTTKFTPKMQAIRKEMEGLEEKKKKGELKPEDYKRMASLSTEWQMRYQLFDEAENNVVDRYAANQSQRMAQDYAWSRNNVETVACGAGKQVLEHRAKKDLPETETPAEPNAAAEAQKKFENLSRAVRMSFFRNNGLFADTDEGWKEIGVDRSTIEALPKKAGDPAPVNEQAFADLMEYCGGKKGLENLQPSPRDRLFGAGSYVRKVDEFADKRNAIIDEVFDRYASPLLKEVLKEQEKQLDEQMQEHAQQGGGQDQQQQNKQQGQSGDEGQQDQKKGEQDKGKSEAGQDKKEGQKKGESEGSGEEQDKQQPGEKGRKSSKGKDQEDKAESQEAGSDGAEDKQKSAAGADEEKGEGKQGKGDQQKKDGQQQKQQSGGNGEREDDKPEEGKDEQTGEQKPEAGNQGGGFGSGKGQGEAGQKSQNGQGQPGESDSGEVSEEAMAEALAAAFNPQNQEGKGSEGQTVEVQGVGEMPDIKLPPKSPRPEKNKGEDKDALKDEQTIKELTAEEKEPDKLDDPLKNSGGPGSNSHGGSYSFDAPTAAPTGQWNDYMAIVTPQALTIRYISDMLKKIQEKQVHFVPQPVKERTLLPEDGDLGRFQLPEHRDLMVKRFRGQEISERDFDRFTQDTPDKKVPAPIDIVIMIDGSGSMRGAKMDNAVKTGVTLYEAAKLANLNPYVLMWGNNPPMVLAKPGDNPVAIGKAIAAAKDGYDWGTDLAPAIKTMTKTIADRKCDPESFAGCSHFFVVSDGDINDYSKACETVKQLMEHCPHVTLDVAIINPNHTHMDSLMEQVAQTGKNKCGVKHFNNAEDIQQGLVDLLRGRMLTGDMKAIPYREKTSELKTANRRM